MPFSNENFVDIRDGTKGVFADLAAVSTGRQVLPKDDGTPEQVRFGRVTTNFLRVMGARIALGRDSVDADGEPPPPSPQSIRRWRCVNRRVAFQRPSRVPAGAH